MQGRKYENTGKARKEIGDAAYASLIAFLVVIFIVASVAALLVKCRMVR